MGRRDSWRWNVLCGAESRLFAASDTGVFLQRMHHGRRFMHLQEIVVMPGSRARFSPAPPRSVRWLAAVLGTVAGAAGGVILVALAPGVVAGSGGQASMSNPGTVRAGGSRLGAPLSVAAVLAPAPGNGAGAAWARAQERP